MLIKTIILGVPSIRIGKIVVTVMDFFSSTGDNVVSFWVASPTARLINPARSGTSLDLYVARIDGNPA